MDQTDLNPFPYDTTLPTNIILESVVGSTLHGTSVDDGLEDLDLMSVVIEDMEQVVGFETKDTWVKRTKPEGVRSEAGDIDLVMYGLRKYVQLILKGNPTKLLLLFTPQEQIRRYTKEGLELRSMVDLVVSKMVYTPFRHYVLKQHERLLNTRGQMNVTRPELIERYGFDTKYAGHIVRLGFQGEELLRTGRITLPMPEEQRTIVRSVRTGGYSLEQVSGMIVETYHRLDEALRASPLPDEPDYRSMENWMLETYLCAWRR